MLLTIWRHGEAGDAASDRERELTRRGVDDVTRGARRFCEVLDRRDLPAPDAIWHSPWRRTTQTAAILADAFPRAAVERCAAVQPGATIAGVEAALQPLFSATPAPEHLLLVSHQPLVSRLAEHFLGASTVVPGLSPGSCVVLALDVPAAACATLVFWALPPDYEAGA